MEAQISSLQGESGTKPNRTLKPICHGFILFPCLQTPRNARLSTNLGFPPAPLSPYLSSLPAGVIGEGDLKIASVTATDLAKSKGLSGVVNAKEPDNNVIIGDSLKSALDIQASSGRLPPLPLTIENSVVDPKHVRQLPPLRNGELRPRPQVRYPQVQAEDDNFGILHHDKRHLSSLVQLPSASS